MVVDGLFSVFSLCFSRKWEIPTVDLWTSLAGPFDFYSWPHPQYFSGYTDDMSFYQRLVTTAMSHVVTFFIKQQLHGYFSFTNKLCNKAKTPVYQSLSTINFLPHIYITSFGFEFPRATLPLTDYVGPMIPQSQPQLPQDIAEWLDWRDPRSVVYVSMGSAVVLTSEQAEMIINGASQANLSVVWSLRNSNQHILEHMTYDPDSVLISEWVPQVTILKHPSIHSAILHGGLGGIQEALTSGVPIIIVPFFGDQLDNTVRVQYYHYGEMINLHEVTTPLVTLKLRLINSELYRKSLKKIQRIYKKDGGASRAADLVEFYSDVGYEHLVPSYIKYNWSWVEFHNVVYAVLILALLLPSYIFTVSTHPQLLLYSPLKKESRIIYSIIIACCYNLLIHVDDYYD